MGLHLRQQRICQFWRNRRRNPYAKIHLTITQGNGHIGNRKLIQQNSTTTTPRKICFSERHRPTFALATYLVAPSQMNFARTKKAAEIQSSLAPEWREWVEVEARFHGTAWRPDASPVARHSLRAPILLKREGGGRVKQNLRRLLASFLTSKMRWPSWVESGS